MATKVTLATKLGLWLCFGVGVSLVPIAANVFKVRIMTESSYSSFPNEQSLSILELVSYKGELLLLAVGLSAAGIGDVLDSLLRQNARWPGPMAIIGALCFLNVMCGIALYVTISIIYEQFGTNQIFWVKWGSLVSYGAAVMASALCVALSEDR